MALEVDTFYRYLDAIPILDSNETLEKLTIADWPNIKESSRSKILSSLRSSAKQSNYNNKPVELSNADVAKILLGK